MKFPLSIIGASLVLLSSLPTASGVILSFNPTSTIDFQDLAVDQALNTVPGWTGSSYVVGAISTGTGNPGSMVITTGPDRRDIKGPAITPAFTGDQLFFSAWVMRSSGASGARIKAMAGETQIAGFGILDTSPQAFVFYGDTDPSDEVTTLGWIQSSVLPKVNLWYELALVIDFNATTPSESIGNLYYRPVTTSEYTLLPEFTNVQMSWFTSELNPTDFTNWEIYRIRTSAQVDNLALGMVIPEPHVGVLTGVAAVGLIFLNRMRKK